MGVELRAVQARHFEFKCHQPAFPHVVNMPSAPRGIKRKFHSEGDDGSKHFSVFCSHQRQSIFNISMCKLSRFRQSPDPSLLRSVLICNTLRNIERDMERDGIRLNCCLNTPILSDHQNDTLDPPPPPAPPDPRTESAVPHGGLRSLMEPENNALSLQVNSRSEHSESRFHTNIALLQSNSSSNLEHHNFVSNNNNNNGSCSNEYEKCLLELEPGSGRTTPFPKNIYVDAGALWNDDGDRLTSLNWSSVLNFNLSGGSSNSSQDSKNHSECSNSSSETSLHTLMPATNGNVLCSTSALTTLTNYPSSSSNSSCSSSGSDEIFGDIDLSLYDFDLLSPLSPPNVKLAPVSAEELMRSLSGANETVMSAASSVAPSTCQSGSFYKSELYNDDHATPVMT